MIMQNGNWSSRENSPTSKTIPFGSQKVCSPIKARYIKFRALRNIDGNDEIGYAEVDVITN